MASQRLLPFYTWKDKIKIFCQQFLMQVATPGQLKGVGDIPRWTVGKRRERTALRKCQRAPEHYCNTDVARVGPVKKKRHLKFGEVCAVLMCLPRMKCRHVRTELTTNSSGPLASLRNGGRRISRRDMKVRGGISSSGCVCVLVLRLWHLVPGGRACDFCRPPLIYASGRLVKKVQDNGSSMETG